MICHKIHPLPDIEMYGGDTTSWEISLVHEDGTALDIGSDTSFTCTLTLRPYGVKSATNSDLDAAPVLKIEGTTFHTLDKAYVRFDFQYNHTINLRGKFLYQVDVRLGSEVRICQGVLNIKQNINVINI